MGRLVKWVKEFFKDMRNMYEYLSDKPNEDKIVKKGGRDGV